MNGFSSSFLLSQSYLVFKAKLKCQIQEAIPDDPAQKGLNDNTLWVSRLQLVTTSPYVFEVGFVVVLQMRGRELRGAK